LVEFRREGEIDVEYIGFGKPVKRMTFPPMQDLPCIAWPTLLVTPFAGMPATVCNVLPTACPGETLREGWEAEARRPVTVSFLAQERPLTAGR